MSWPSATVDVLYAIHTNHTAEDLKEWMLPLYIQLEGGSRIRTDKIRHNDNVNVTFTTGKNRLVVGAEITGDYANYDERKLLSWCRRYFQNATNRDLLPVKTEIMYSSVTINAGHEIEFFQSVADTYCEGHGFVYSSYDKFHCPIPIPESSWSIHKSGVFIFNDKSHNVVEKANKAIGAFTEFMEVYNAAQM